MVVVLVYWPIYSDHGISRRYHKERPDAVVRSRARRRPGTAAARKKIEDLSFASSSWMYKLLTQMDIIEQYSRYCVPKVCAQLPTLGGELINFGR